MIKYRYARHELKPGGLLTSFSGIREPTEVGPGEREKFLQFYPLGEIGISKAIR